MLLFLAGTSDARELAHRLQQAGIPLLASVVTESAAQSLRAIGLSVRVGRLNQQQMIQLIQTNRIIQIVDASHPFAEEASKNAIAAAKACRIPYLRYERPGWVYDHHPRLHVVDTYEAAAQLAAIYQGTIMLTTGSKTLDIFVNRLSRKPNLRLVARMLPRIENLEKCRQLGIEQKNIIAMQGPFSRELNQALYRHYDVTVVVTKESGTIGSVDEKVTAALEMGLEVIMIARPRLSYGQTYSNFAEIVELARQRYK
jgi:precorrin-6A/cobalt-precorrin-6A reductase